MVILKQVFHSLLPHDPVARLNYYNLYRVTYLTQSPLASSTHPLMEFMLTEWTM